MRNDKKNLFNNQQQKIMTKPCVSYLAAPYSHKDLNIQNQRYCVVNVMAAQLIQQGQLIYSPLTHNVNLIKFGLQEGWQNWQTYDCEMLSRCNKLPEKDTIRCRL